MIIYDNYFSSRMPENPGFQTWYKEFYLKKFPTPPRNWVSFTAEETEKEGFYLIKHEWIKNTIDFSLGELTGFLLTLTNVIATVEGGNEKIEDVESWLTENLSPFFQGAREEFLFSAPIWFLQREF